jgi:hypothetical protein
LLSSGAFAAVDLFIEPLYWRATEAIDWTGTNNLNSTNQMLSYKTIAFNFTPAFRVGAGYDHKDWDTRFYYTRFYTEARDSYIGGQTSSFLAARLVQPAAGYLYQSSQVHFQIKYNMLDWDIGKRFQPTASLMLRPLLGLEGGWINQNVNSNLQGTTSVAELLQNNFSGIGPKLGIQSTITLLNREDYKLSLLADFTSAYLWGHWSVTDALVTNTGRTANIDTGSRYMGALTVGALMGLGFDYKQFSAKLGYEINDWFNQCQLFDNGTGAHTNDLILQGLTLGFTYQF